MVFKFHPVDSSVAFELRPPTAWTHTLGSAFELLLTYYSALLAHTLGLI